MLLTAVVNIVIFQAISWMCVVVVVFFSFISFQTHSLGQTNMTLYYALLPSQSKFTNTHSAQQRRILFICIWLKPEWHRRAIMYRLFNSTNRSKNVWAACSTTVNITAQIWISHKIPISFLFYAWDMKKTLRWPTFSAQHWPKAFVVCMFIFSCYFGNFSYLLDLFRFNRAIKVKSMFHVCYFIVCKPRNQKWFFF